MYKNLQQTEHGQNQQGLPSLKYMCGELVAGVGVEPGTQGHLLTERWELVVAGVLMAFVPLLQIRLVRRRALLSALAEQKERNKIQITRMEMRVPLGLLQHLELQPCFVLPVVLAEQVVTEELELPQAALVG